MTAWQESLRSLAGRLVTGLMYGAVCGALVGGVGGRLAMFVLRLTSSDHLRGLDTDDGFEIGSFTGGTVFLVVATSALGAVAGVAYVGLRRWLPERLRPVSAGVLAGAVGGAAVVEPEGLDFTLLDPLLLAVVLFVALPAAFGVLLSILLERALTDVRAFPALVLLAPAVLLSLTGITGITIVLVLVAGTYVGTAWPAVKELWNGDAARWVGRAALVAVAIFAAVDLTRDAREILG